MQKKSFDDRKQGTHLNNLLCPAASCGPFAVRGFTAILWPKDSCANDRGVRVEEDGVNEFPKKESNARPNLPTRLGVSRNRHLPQHTQKFIQRNTSSVKALRKNNVKPQQTSAELQTNACSLRDDEKAVLHLPQIIPQSQQLRQRNTVSTEKGKKKVEKAECHPLTGDWSLTPWLADVSDDDQWFDEWFEEDTSQAELKKDETKRSAED